MKLKDDRRIGMHIEGLDEVDNQILNLIREDARMSFSDIGKAVGVSRVSVKTRMQAMEEKGIIGGYKTVICPQNVPNMIHFTLDLETAPESYAKLMDEVGSSKLIRQLYCTTGECRMHAVGLAPNQAELNRFANYLYNSLGGVRRLTCQTILAVKKDLDGGVGYERYQKDEYLEGRRAEKG
jgi:DNA-binding Lrp family transcriptional regulator